MNRLKCDRKGWLSAIAFSIVSFSSLFQLGLVSVAAFQPSHHNRAVFRNNAHFVHQSSSPHYSSKHRLCSEASEDMLSKKEDLTASAGERNNAISTRRNIILSSLAKSASVVGIVSGFPSLAFGEDEGDEVLVGLTGDAKKLFNQGRALEMQGNMAAANRIYEKVTKIVPRFIYGWSNLGNTEVVLGNLENAELSYTKSINLCTTQREQAGDQFAVRRCDDLYILLLNRGSLRLNNKMKKEALQDLELAASLRGKPDAVILQNRARARELNGIFGPADRDYDLAISMTSNEVAPFWLRSAMVKFQIGDTIGAFDLLRRVEVKFPEAPEVRAALAVMLFRKGDQVGAQRKFLEIPDRARSKFGEEDYLKETVSWTPAMIEYIAKVRSAVGDS